SFQPEGSSRTARPSGPASDRISGSFVRKITAPAAGSPVSSQRTATSTRFPSTGVVLLLAARAVPAPPVAPTSGEIASPPAPPAAVTGPVGEGEGDLMVVQ